MYIVKKNKNKKWIVILSGAKRATKTFDSKAEAILYATKICKDKKTTFIVQEDERKAKKKTSLWIFLVVLVVLGIGIFVYLCCAGKIKIPGLDKEPEDTPPVVVSTDLEIHFLEVGNKATGDSIYIKAGEIDILIDAGSKASSASTITSYINRFCTDGKLEYVIATHAHEDHIAGFVGTASVPGIFDNFEVEVIIDYALKNTTSTISKNYEAKRDLLVSQGTKHYTAADCIKRENGAQNKYTLSDGIQLEILDQRYYYESSSDENNYSVCAILHQSDNHFLFTGDLEAEGEESLVEKNELPHCKVFKAGHHGSKTSSNEALLSVITPEIVCVCCCAGSSEYTKDTDNMFPTQAFIDRVAKYTSQVFVTTLATYEVAVNDGKDYLKVTGFESMNGDIVVTSTKDGISINCSNNNTILKDSAWFNTTITLNGESRKMRIWPVNGK